MMFGAMKHAFPKKILVDEIDGLFTLRINDIPQCKLPPLYFLYVLPQMLKLSEPSHREIMKVCERAPISF